MARYIDTTKLMNNMVTFVSPKLAQSIIKAVDETPTEDVAPIVRGKWIYKDFNWYCSNCNQRVSTPGYVGTVEFMKEHFKICNHCGAKMEEREEE